MSFRTWINTIHPKEVNGIWSGLSIPKGLRGKMASIRFTGSEDFWFSNQLVKCGLIARRESGMDDETWLRIRLELELHALWLETKFDHNYDEVVRQLDLLLCGVIESQFCWWKKHYHEVRINKFVSVFFFLI